MATLRRLLLLAALILPAPMLAAESAKPPADLPAVVRNNRSVEAGDGPPDSRPGELAPRAGGPPVS